MKSAENILQEARNLFNAKQYKQSLSLLNNPELLDEKFLLQKYVLEAAIAVRTDQVDQALELIEKAESKFSAVDESTVNIKAVAYRAKGELQKAKGILQGGVEKFPKSIDLAHNLSVTAADLGEFELAEKAGLQALEINPKYVETFKNLGRIYVTTRNTLKARELFERLNTISGNSVDVLVGLGAIELIDFNPKKAKTYFEKALQKDDSLSAAWANLGLCHKFLGNYLSAKKCLETAAQKDAKQVEHVWNLSIVNLALGNFKEGWDQYEIRYNPKRIATDAVKLPTTQIPMLTRDDSVQGKTVILVQEQGYGDTFQFFRYAKLLKEEGAKKVVAIVSVEMVDIIRTIPWVDEIRSEMKGSQEAPDYWVFSMSLPARYHTDSVDQVPVFAHYLSVEAASKQRWAEALGSRAGKKLRVGLVWAGRETHSNDANRSLAITQLEPLLQLHEQIEFISLQKGSRESEVLADPRIISCGSQLNNFADTAALLSNLDLLISVDSSPVHLAGALGMPVWTLIPSIFDFRWLVNKEESPWYPSMKLFRQPIGKSWETVILRIRKELESLLAKSPVRWMADEYTLLPEFAIGKSNLAGNTLFVNCAFQHHLQGQLQTAEALYKKCLETDPRSLDAIRNLAALYRGAGDFHRSLSVYQYGETKGMQDAIFFTNYANLLIDLKQFKEAMQKADAALSINPLHEPAQNAKKQCLLLVK